MQTSLFICDEYEARSYPGPGFPCQYFENDCYHGACKVRWLRANGADNVASRLERNWKAQDWLGNWGRLLYDPKEHGRDSKRRSAAAKIVRAFRNGAGDYVDIVRAGVWLGATM